MVHGSKQLVIAALGEVEARRSARGPVEAVSAVIALAELLAN
jgi:hypothetical protein